MVLALPGLDRGGVRRLRCPPARSSPGSSAPFRMAARVVRRFRSLWVASTTIPLRSWIVTLCAFFVLNGVIGPVVEELYFRGFLLPRMERLGRWAPLVNATLFSIYHFWSPWQIGSADSRDRADGIRRVVEAKRLSRHGGALRAQHTGRRAHGQCGVIAHLGINEQKENRMPEQRTTQEFAPLRTDRPLRQIVVFLCSTYAIAVAIAVALPHAGITPLAQHRRASARASQSPWQCWLRAS